MKFFGLIDNFHDGTLNFFPTLLEESQVKQSGRVLIPRHLVMITSPRTQLWDVDR
jgi:hypothetical protein